jgi:hypothetical protein
MTKRRSGVVTCKPINSTYFEEGLIMTGKKYIVNTDRVTIEEVRDFWQRNPLCVNGIPYLVGTPQCDGI